MTELVEGQKRPLYRKILIATDGSAQTKKAVEHAIELARLMSAKLYIVYVVDNIAFASIPLDMKSESMYEALHKEGLDATNSVADAASEKGVDAETVVLEGNPAEEIVDFAKNNEIGLIVLGMLGKSGLERFLLGSVAEKVARASPVPVMIVRGA
ncbi:MAG: universal stress protein [Methanocellales archaeon]|nr:universal stress protein [Methanocellales archaeon]